MASCSKEGKNENLQDDMKILIRKHSWVDKVQVSSSENRFALSQVHHELMGDIPKITVPRELTALSSPKWWNKFGLESNGEFQSKAKEKKGVRDDPAPMEAMHLLHPSPATRPLVAGPPKEISNSKCPIDSAARGDKDNLVLPLQFPMENPAVYGSFFKIIIENSKFSPTTEASLGSIAMWSLKYPIRNISDETADTSTFPHMHTKAKKVKMKNDYWLAPHVHRWGPWHPRFARLGPASEAAAREILCCCLTCSLHDRVLHVCVLPFTSLVDRDMASYVGQILGHLWPLIQLQRSLLQVLLWGDQCAWAHPAAHANQARHGDLNCVGNLLSSREHSLPATLPMWDI